MANIDTKWLQVEAMIRSGMTLEDAMRRLVVHTPMWALQYAHKAFLEQQLSAYDNRTEEKLHA